VFTYRQTPKVTEYPDIFSYHKITEIESKISNRIQEVAPDIRRKALYLSSTRLNSNKLNGSFMLEITDMLHSERLRSFLISEFHGADFFPFR
jgi:hypothetical protein